MPICMVMCILTHFFPVHPFSTPGKPYGFLMFSEGEERVHWEQMVKCRLYVHFQLDSNQQPLSS